MKPAAAHAMAKAVRTGTLFRTRIVKTKKCFKRHAKHRVNHAEAN